MPNNEQTSATERAPIFEPVPLDRVFADRRTVEASAKHAVVGGGTDVILDPYAGEMYATLSVLTDDIDTTRLSAREQASGFSNRPLLEVPILSSRTEQFAEYLQTAAEERAEKFLAAGAAWYLRHEPLRKNIEDGGMLQQAVEFSNGEDKTLLLNISERTLSPDEIEEMRRTVESIAQRTNGASLNAVKYIVVQGPEYFRRSNSGRRVLGQAFHDIGLARLNANIFDKQEEDKDYGQALDTTPAQNTLTHEMYHIIGDSGLDGRNETSMVAKAIGWEEHDDPHNLSGYGKSWRLGRPPLQSWTYRDGHYVQVPTEELLREGQDVKPVSWYGATTAVEDAPEAFVPYVHDDSKLVLDGVRRNALHNKVRNIIAVQARKEGPQFVAAQERAPAKIHFGEVEAPRQIRLRPNMSWHPATAEQPY